MNYKIEGAIRKNKKNFIIFGILWLLIAIVFVSPIAYSSHIANATGTLDIGKFVETITRVNNRPFWNIRKSV